MWGHFFKIFGRRPPKRTLIRDLKVGKVHCIEGDALAIGKPILAPFSGAECASLSVFHSHAYNVPTSNGRTMRRWSEREELVYGLSFYVRDESGLVRVARGLTADVFAMKFNVAKVSADNRYANLRNFWQQELEDEAPRKKLKTLFDTSPKSRHHEVIIAEGSRVRVVGRVQSSGEPLPVDASVGFRESPTMLELVATKRKKLRITRIKRTS